ncbi:MAG: ATP-dependent helicase [Candidatus Zixiibacteriota bacterium]
MNDKYDPIDRYKAVVEHGRGLLVVSAGPGTGKTYSLLRKIERLIELKVDPSQIYYLTFVNSIVDAFESDFRKPKENGGLGVDPDDLGIHISTLHSLAFKIVNVYAEELSLPPHLEVIDLSPKSQSILSRLAVEDIYQYSKCIGLVASKRGFYGLLHQLTEEWRRNKKPAADCRMLEGAVRKLCSRYSVCSWDQLVLLAIKALSENGLPKWLHKAQHFLIDEYQDFNPSEQRLLELVTEPSDSVVIVGDPDQSIYSGRSASPRGLTELLTRDDVEYVNFIYCRRCPKKVIAAANNLLKYMDAVGYADKKLEPCKDEDGNFEITPPFKSCKEEVRYIAEKIKALDESDKAETIILLPQKKVADYYAKKLSELGIYCKVKAADISGDLLLAVLRFVVLHGHPFLLRLLLSYFPNLERKYGLHVLPVFIDGVDCLIDTLRQASIEQKWQKKSKKFLSDLIGTIEELLSGDVDSIVAGLSDLNHEVSKNVIVSLLGSDTNMSARERVEIALHTDEGESRKTKDAAVPVEVMTMHSSKGLSKQLIIIPAFDEKLLPGDNSGERLTEMHRLVYVAITRAEEQVVVTFPRTRAKGDPLNYGEKPRISRYADVLVPPEKRQG